jgi:hypothetical protein
MKASIISTIVATLLAASSAAPVDSSRQFEVSVTFYDPNEHFITQYFPADGNKYPISKFFFSFFSFLLYVSSKKDREF